MSLLPILLQAEDQHILIVGSTVAAIAKVNLFLDKGIRLTVVDPNAEGALLGAGISAVSHNIEFHNRRFNASDLADKTLVYVGLESEDEVEGIRAHAHLKRVLVNVIDRGDLSDFITPAQISRGPIELAFSSGGKSPVFIRRIRAALEQVLPTSLAVLAEAAGAVRSGVASKIVDLSDRRQFWEGVYDNADEYNGLNQEQAEEKLLKRANNNEAPKAGFVQLVGAGPGDLDLLTLKAHRALQQADVIVYDNLVSREVLTAARRDAELVFVGKKEGDHGQGQRHIHEVLVSHASQGKRVVRLKGGDPMLFARAGEELDILRKAGIETEVVPGITALSGIAATTQIPLTDRDHSSAVTLITGRLQDGSTQDWASLAGEGRTLAVYMGLKTASEISSGLIEGGIDPATPVAIVENGTRANERQLYTSLLELPSTAAQYQVKSPALLIIGEVVSKAATLNQPVEDEYIYGAYGY